MNNKELLNIISNGENYNLEFKRDNLRPEQLAKEIVAFANFQGGRILLGVEDDGSISGIQRENLQDWLMDTVFGRFIHPQIIPFYEEIIMDDGKKVAVVTVVMGTTKGFDQLDKRRLEQYLVEIIEDDEIPTSEQAWHQKLQNLDLMVATEFGTPVCTITGLSLFGKQPCYGLPQAGIHLLVFSGKEMDYDASLDEILNIPFTGLTSAINRRDILEYSLPDRVLYYLQPYISEERLISMRRIRCWDYPKAVIRELIVNAFAHRDWTNPNTINLSIYANRLEITSPGGLANSMTIEKMKAGQRFPRNPIITNILRDYNFMDNRGMGIRRKIIPLMKEHNGTEVNFEVTEDYVKVTLWK